MTPLPLEMVKGTARDFALQAQYPDGTVPTGVFQSSDALAAALFVGDGQTPLLTPTVQWVTASAGTYIVTFNNADTATLDTGTFNLVVTATRGGRSVKIGQVDLTLLPNSGAGTALTSYCQFADMLDYAPYLSKIENLSDYEGFARQRHLARTWLENIIQKHYRLNAGTGLTTFGNSVVSFGPRRLGGDNVILQGFLNAGYLMVADPKRVIEITAKYAAALACQSQITGTDAKANFYQQKADWLFNEANNAVIGYTAEVDINGDGYPEYTIACGTSDALYG